MNGIFAGCTSLTTINRINDWNTSGITIFSSMFLTCSNFNQPLSFNTSAATSMLAMFQGCTIFNSTIIFNTANVTSMGSMFAAAPAFNQDVNSFNVSKVANFTSMFNGATNFNNGLASGVAGVMTWNLTTTGSTTLDATFFNCRAFNQEVGNWNVSRSTLFGQMFQNCFKFNNGNSPSINSWIFTTTGTLNMLDFKNRTALSKIMTEELENSALKEGLDMKGYLNDSKNILSSRISEVFKTIKETKYIIMTFLKGEVRLAKQTTYGHYINKCKDLNIIPKSYTDFDPKDLKELKKLKS